MAPNTIIEDIHKIREEYAKDFNCLFPAQLYKWIKF